MRASPRRSSRNGEPLPARASPRSSSLREEQLSARASPRRSLRVGEAEALPSSFSGSILSGRILQQDAPIFAPTDRSSTTSQVAEHQEQQLPDTEELQRVEAENVVAAQVALEAAREAGMQPAILAQLEAEVGARRASLEAQLQMVSLSSSSRSASSQAGTRSQSEVSKSEARLMQVLSDYNKRATNIVGGGACQFRAVAGQLFQNQERHPEVRRKAIKQLRNEPYRYSALVRDESWPEYLIRMADPQTWGDDISLQALADSYNIKMIILTSQPESQVKQVFPSAAGKPARTIWLGCLAEEDREQYMSLEEERELSSSRRRVSGVTACSSTVAVFP